MKLRNLERHLRAQGCRSLREGGAYTVWFNPSNRKITSVPRHREIKEGTARGICKQPEIQQPSVWTRSPLLHKFKVPETTDRRSRAENQPRR
jgi:predicted RNA binding protein YcfA (HicA-like mRNA interferase family)